MGQGEDKIARSLLDLQPTAIVEFYRIYPDVIKKPTMSIDVHGGSIFKQPVTWQGIKYLPVPIEAEGFELTANGKLPRPKIRIANKDFLITSLLQNNDDFKNAEIVRKRTFVKYLDDVNFDGDNPFGGADSTAEISEERYVIGQKTQENKVLVEFELTSTLDLENYELNHRRILGKYCYWTYRGAGCQYEGPPINTERGQAFRAAGTGAVIVPDISDFNSSDPNSVWQATKGYMPSDIVYTENKKVIINPNPNFFGERLNSAKPLKNWYVCVSGNTGQRPEDNPTYWAKDGCNKKLSSCKLRFNSSKTVKYEKFGIAVEEDSVEISGNAYLSRKAGREGSKQRGILISNEESLTGFYTDDEGNNVDWTIALFGDFGQGGHLMGVLDTRSGWADFAYSSEGLSSIPQGTAQSEATDEDGDVGVANRRGKFTWYYDAGSRWVGKNAIGAGIPVKNADHNTRHGVGVSADKHTRAIISFGVRRGCGRTLLVMGYDSENRIIKTYNISDPDQTLEQPAYTMDIRGFAGPNAEFDARTNCFSLGSNLNYNTANRGHNPITTPNAAQASAHVKYIGCAIWKRELEPSHIKLLLEKVREKASDEEGDLVQGAGISTMINYNNAPDSLTGFDSKLLAWWQDVRVEGSEFNFVDAHGGMTGGMTTPNIGPPPSSRKRLNLTGYHDIFSGTAEYIRPEFVTYEENIQYYHLPFGGFPGTDGFTYQA